MEDMSSQLKETPIVRGFGDIQKLYEIVTPLGGYIAGGYVRYCASPLPKPKPYSDVDVYCVDENAFNRIREELDEWLTVKYSNPIMIHYHKPSGKSRAKNHERNPFFSCPSIQLIKPIKRGRLVANGTLEEIIQNFDFSVVRAGIISPTKALVDEDFIKDESKGRLVIKNIHCPISSSLRVAKYISKGYKIRHLEVLKLFLDWEERPEEYRVDLAQNMEALYNNELSFEEYQRLYELMSID